MTLIASGFENHDSVYLCFNSFIPCMEVFVTIKHSIRMYTTRLETVCASVSVQTSDVTPRGRFPNEHV